MSDLFTKAANIRTTTKLSIVGIALLIMVNIPYADNHYQPSPAATPVSNPPSVEPLSTPTVAGPKTRPLVTTGIPVQPTVPLTPVSSAAGDYTGTVHNETAAVSADFAIKLEDSGGTLSGSMTVKPPLYGSGPLKGFASGADVAFTVMSATGKIAFTGTRIKRTITGTYTVTQPTGGIEKGTFSLDQISRARQEPLADEQRELTAAPATLPDSRLSESMRTPVAAPVAPSAIERPDPRNLSNCMYGMLSCNRGLLTEKEQAAVAESARRRNLSNCMYGMPSCDHRPLSETEEAAVAQNDRKRNLSNCLYGMVACNRNLLTPEELIQVQARDKQRQH